MKTKIGGQAVLEGVMMRGERSMALSVRDEGGNIRTETTRLADKKTVVSQGAVSARRGQPCNLYD